MSSSDHLGELLADYKQLQESLQSAKTKLTQLAATQQDQRCSAERDAMWLEDRIAHARPELIDFYSTPFSENRRGSARDKLTQTYRAAKANPGKPGEYAAIRRSIEEMMEQIAVQQQLLNDEEAAISKLREAELQSRQREDQLYESLLQEVHAISAQYETACSQNKGKKRSLFNLQNSNADLQKCVEQAKEEIDRARKSLEQMRQQSATLAQRHKAAQGEQQRSAALQEKMSRIEEENEKLRRKESELSDTLASLQEEVDDKQSELSSLMKAITRAQDEIDASV
jgi:chromosome segregation ATPase